ncbi:MAG: hypothetical protein HOP10_12770 [Chitinophagaceae bacterium]|nr:hypothetical protein [Chitinophagaceae bacterium]
MLKKRIKYCVWVFALLIVSSSASAQADTTAVPIDTLYTVGKITITGNKKTKDVIILREIPFREGDQYTLKTLIEKFGDAHRQLLNTSLFHTAEVGIKNMEGTIATIAVTLKERWYFFPTPFLKPVDRNLNQWIVEQKASLDRVNYGVKFIYYNATGRNDKLKGSFGSGYTRQFSLGYDRPYFDKNLKWGFSTGFSVSKNREVNYNTVHDKQVFVKDEDVFLSNFATIYTTLTYRRKIKTKHSLGFAYTSGEVSDTVVTLNSSYFKGGRQRVQFPDLLYAMSYFDVDFIPYPTKGYAAQITFNKKGFGSAGVNVWQLGVQASGTWHIGKKSFVNVGVYGGLKLPFKQPYYNQRFLGYGDVYMQGYEYYVIDGVAGGYLKTGLYQELFNFKIKVPPLKKGKEPMRIPFRIVGKTYGNTGYVHNPQPGNNLLSNKMLYSGGFGVDIITFYDIVLKLEYSFNQLGENGLFLHRKSIF